jgi:hypothetical protein
MTDMTSYEATGETFELETFMAMRVRTRSALDSIATQGAGRTSWRSPNLFIDIGPIYEGTEGDAGETFVFGDDPDYLRAKLDVRIIWDDVRQVWLDEHLTGVGLHYVARKTASDLGGS